MLLRSGRSYNSCYKHRYFLRPRARPIFRRGVHGHGRGENLGIANTYGNIRKCISIKGSKCNSLYMNNYLFHNQPNQSSEPTQRRRRSVCYRPRPAKRPRKSTYGDGKSTNLNGIPNYCTSRPESIHDGLMTDSAVESSSIMDPDVSRTSNHLPFQMQHSNGVTEETLRGLEAVIKGFASVMKRSASINEDFASGLNTMKSLLEKGRDIPKGNQTKIENLQNLIQVGGLPLLYSPEPQFVEFGGRRYQIIINNPVTPTVIGGQVRETNSPPTLERMEV